jgi:hypothetical protein
MQPDCPSAPPHQGVANDREGVVADLAVGHDVVGANKIKIVYFAPRHELINELA